MKCAIILREFQIFDTGTLSNKASDRKSLTYEQLIHTFYKLSEIFFKDFVSLMDCYDFV